MIAADMASERRAVAGAEPAQRRRRHIGPTDPWRNEFRAKRDQQQNLERADALDRAIEQFEARRIDPVDVFEEHQHGLTLRQGFELPHQCGECPFLADLRCQIERGIPLVGPAQGQQLRDQRAILR